MVAKGDRAALLLLGFIVRACLTSTSQRRTSSARATYFPRMSNSRLTALPLFNCDRFVWLQVNGITWIWNLSLATLATVKLIPSTAIDPLLTIREPNAAGNAMVSL